MLKQNKLRQETNATNKTAHPLVIIPQDVTLHNKNRYI